MPRTKSDFEECLLAQTLAMEILNEDKANTNPVFKHMDVKKIKFLLKKGKSKTAYAYIHGIGSFYTKLTDYKYVIVVNEHPFMDQPDDIKKKIIFHELLHIHEDFDGGIVKHDVQDFMFILKKFGLDWKIPRIESDPSDNTPGQTSDTEEKTQEDSNEDQD